MILDPVVQRSQSKTAITSRGSQSAASGVSKRARQVRVCEIPLLRTGRYETDDLDSSLTRKSIRSILVMMSEGVSPSVTSTASCIERVKIAET
jgi:hypothetical protein